MSIECVEFMTENRKAIIDMVMAEFTSQESCVYLETCIAPDLKEVSTPNSSGNIGKYLLLSSVKFLSTWLAEHWPDKRLERMEEDEHI